MSDERQRHFSMFRQMHAADVLTLANAACGTASVFSSMAFMQDGSLLGFYRAAALLPLALVFDALDGRVARWRRRHSELGRELDSLADVISFGVAPAALAFAAGLRTLCDVLVLLYFVACGVSRLARFNVTADLLSDGGDSVKYFEGTPIPTSVVLVALLALLAYADRIGDALYLGRVGPGALALHPLALIFLLSGSLMVSKTLRIPKI